MKADMGAALFDRAGAHNGNDAMAGMEGNPSVRSRRRRASHQPDLSTHKQEPRASTSISTAGE
jgi:hypothetical protein